MVIEGDDGNYAWVSPVALCVFIREHGETSGGVLGHSHRAL